MIDFNQWGPDNKKAVDNGTMQDEMAKHGYSTGELIADGKIHRFTIQGDKARSNNGWYVLHADLDFSAGSFGSWKTGEQFTWCSRSTAEMNEAEREEFARRMEEIKRQREVEQAKIHKECAEWCRETWEESSPAPPNHQYLIKKGVKPHGARLYKDSLLIPLVEHTNSHIVGCQFIQPDGTKMFKTGTAKKGAYFIIPGFQKKVLCEGWATGASIHEATGYTVVVAFDAGNLLEVARVINPDIVAADNDIWTFKKNMKPEVADDTPKDSYLWEQWRSQGIMENPGLTKGEEAAKAVGARLVYPVGIKGTDFNDLHCEKGLNSVSEYFKEQQHHKQSLFVCAKDELLEPVKVDYLIHKRIEYGTTNVLFGPTGGGKSFVAIDMACSIVTGKPWDSNKVVRRGTVLVLAGEGRGGIVRRLKAWCQYNEIDPEELSELYVSRHTLLMDGSNIDEICNEMANKEVVLIIVDTLNRHLDGDENTTKDMSAFIKHVDMLRDRMGSTMMVVHHPGHGDPTRGRGNSSLKAALDGEISCNRGVLEWTKTKDMETPNNIEFKLHQVKIGIDEEGTDITSCVPQYGERSEQYDQDMTEFERIAIDALVKASAKAGIQKGNMWGALVGDWRNEFSNIRKQKHNENDPNITADAMKKSFGRAKTGLLQKGVIEEDGNLMVPKRLDHQEDILTYMSMSFMLK